MANSTEIKLIAQAHAQQYNKQQNDYYLQMANNMIAENQQNEKYLQMANEMIANQNKVSQPVQTQKVQPVDTQPVYQKTVNEVKQIPSIADFGKNQDNKTYIQNVIENNILRQQEVGKPYGPMIEEARAQKQSIIGDANKSKEEKVEDSLKEIARIKNISVDEARRLYEQGPSEETITTPGTSVLNYKAADELADDEKIQKYLDVNKKLTASENEDARKIAQQVLDKYDYRSGNIPVLNSEEDRKRYADAVNLLNKTSPVANFSQSFLSPYTNLARSVRDSLNVMANQTQEGTAKVTDALGITKNAKSKAAENIAKRQQAFDSIDQSTNTATDNASVQNPLLSGAGNLLGNMSQYYLSGPLFDALGGAAGLGKTGKFLLNQVGQAGQDVILDVLPEYKKMMEDGQITEEEKLELGNRFGGDVLANMAMASLPVLNNSTYDYLTQTVGKNADILNAMDASGALKNVPDVIREVGDATKQILGIDNVADIYKNEINLEPLNKAQGLVSNSVETAGAHLRIPDGIAATSAPKADAPTQHIEGLPSNVNVTDAIQNVNKNSVNLSAETQEQLLSDFEEYYRALDDMDEAVQKSGNAKALEKFAKLQQAVFDYEDSVWKSDDLDAINKAKKKADAARQSFVREMQKTDSSYKGSLTGTKLGRAEYRRTSIPDSEKAFDAINELENLATNNLKIEEVNLKGGKKGYYIAEVNGNISRNVDSGKVYSTPEEAKEALENLRNNSLESNNNARYYDNVNDVNYTDNGGVDYEVSRSSRTYQENNVGSASEPDIRVSPRSGQRISGGNETGRTLGLRDSNLDDGVLVKNELREKFDNAGIKNQGLKDYSNNYQSFSDALSEGRKNVEGGYGAFVDNKSPLELQEARAKAIMSDDKACTVAVHSDGDITAVCKNPKIGNHPGAVTDILYTARANGGNKLDCYGAGLVNKYTQVGFEPVAKVPYQYGINTEMDAFCKAQKKVNPDFEEPYIYFMKVRDGETIEDSLNALKSKTYKKYTDADLNTLPEMSYDEAAKYRDSLLDMNLQHFAEQPKQGAFFDEMKERGLSKHIVGEDTPMKMEGVSDEVKADFKDNPDMYKVLTNAETKAKAERIYKESSNVEAQFRRLLAQKDPAALPLGHQLAKDYSAAGDHEMAAQIYRDMGNELTKAGQFSQAAAINMMKNDPLTALQYAERQIDNLNQQGAKRFGNKWKDFSLTDEEKSLFDNIKPGDEEAIKSAFDQIGARLGKEYPTTFMDKLLEGRKIAMLFNVRTNVRNFGANIPTLGMRWMADRVEALGQNAAHIINPDIKVTQSLTGSGVQGRKLAKEVFESNKVQAMLKGDVGKYEIPELRNSLVQNKTMYKGTHFEKWLDKITGDGIQKLNVKLFGKQGVQSGLETIRNATYKMLDLGDSPFVKENFVERLGSYIHAQGIKNVEDVPDEAIEMAWEEAMKATYKDNSWAVQMLSWIKGGFEKIPYVGRPISQAAIPFLQAPGNIAARMVDYSPIKATKGIADILSGASKNDVKMVSKGIEEAAKGLTGTGLILLGMALRKEGILTGTYSEDKDQRAFEKQNGFLEFAFHVGDKYFAHDWAQPFAEPLIVGTLLADAIIKSDEYNSDLLKFIDNKAGTNFNDSFASKVLGVAEKGVKASVNSWFNASPLQGLQELMSGGYNGTDIAQNLIDTGVGDFAGGFVPATVNAVAKSTDNIQRNTYDPSNRVSTFVNQQIAKIPGLSKTLPAKYDTWGNELKNADTKAMAWASRFVIPGNYSYDKGDKVDKEINRLYEEVKDAKVFPQVAPNSVGDKKLNNKEMSAYQKDVGTRSRQLVENFMSSDSYSSMDDADKIETISKLYGTSEAITKRDLFGKELASNSPYKGAVEAYDNAGGGEKGVKAVVDYLNAKSASDSAGLSANSNAAKAIQADVSNGDMEAAQEKIDAAQQLPTLGLDKPGPTYAYYNAQKQIPGLTVEEFATTYKTIDTDKNQGIKQDEVIDYLNKNKITSQSEANKIWSAYGNSEWKSIPSIKDGVWTKKKK